MPCYDISLWNKPSPFLRQTAGGSASGRGFFKNTNNNMLMGAAALAVITSLVYWAGYAAEDKRLQKREAKASPK